MVGDRRGLGARARHGALELSAKLRSELLSVIHKVRTDAAPARGRKVGEQASSTDERTAVI